MQHLVGVPVPPLRLTASTGNGVDLTAVGDPWGVLLIQPSELDLTEFGRFEADLADLGAEVYGVCVLELESDPGFPLLLDSKRLLEEGLNLPGEQLTLVFRHARVVHVFHPVPDPAEHAGEVLRWLREDAAAAAA
jgi:peroxiredoxin